jgi:hypothetical protein
MPEAYKNQDNHRPRSSDSQDRLPPRNFVTTRWLGPLGLAAFEDEDEIKADTGLRPVALRT